MTTITQGAVTITPDLVLGYSADRPTGATVHRLVNGGVAVTLAGTGLRSGTLSLFFKTAAAAAAAELALGVAGTFTLTEPGLAQVGMLFALGEGNLVRELDPATLTRWTLQVPFQEVAA